MKESILGTCGLVFGFWILMAIGANTKPSFCRHAPPTGRDSKNGISTMIYFRQICQGFDFGALPVSIQAIPIVTSIALVGGSGQAIALTLLDKYDR